MTAKSAAALEHHNELDADEALALARVHTDKGDIEAALRCIKRVLREPKPSADGLALGGRIYAQLRLFDRAKALFERYLSTNPSALTETFQLGMIHFDSGHAAEAKIIWEDLLKNHPQFPPALFYTALIDAQENRPAPAKQRLDIILKSVAPDNLYFGRAKELLDAIEQQRKILASKTERPVKDPYATEH